eukprot:TRINITY_DN71745_c0_g1_i1.p3 TRINITY_DN71745_c0_g1~~TRINITY_DN71745_c0_g1_i1.p3  ORF type:complete len:150 (-),score=21.04 TRINITY_DN71745_c0_g1_i1:60-509(-)
MESEEYAEIEETIPVETINNGNEPEQPSEAAAFYRAQNLLIRNNLYKVKYPHSDRTRLLYTLAGSKPAKEFIKNRTRAAIKSITKPPEKHYQTQIANDELVNFPMQKYNKLKTDLFKLKAMEKHKSQREPVTKKEVNKWINAQLNRVLN